MHQRTCTTHLAHPCPSESISLFSSPGSSNLIFPVPCLQFPPLPSFSSRKHISWAPTLLQGSALYQVVARSEGYKVTISPWLPPLGKKTC